MQRDTVVGLGPARARTRSPLTSVRRALREREGERKSAQARGPPMARLCHARLANALLSPLLVEQLLTVCVRLAPHYAVRARFLKTR